MNFNPQELEGKSPAELQQRRAELVAQLQKLPNSYQDAPTELLQELAFLTGALRRKNSGPPKVAKVSKRTTTTTPKASLKDLESLL